MIGSTSAAWKTAAALAAAGSLVACSLLVRTDAQCATDGDCAAKGTAFAGTVCRSGACTPTSDAGAPDAAGSGCTKNADCATQTGPFATCRRPDGVCVPVLSTDCDRVVGNYKDDNAVFFGMLYDPTAEQSLQHAVELAEDEFAQTVVGLPGGPGNHPRPIAVLECSQNTDAVRAAGHIADVGATAIVGPTKVSSLVDVVNQVAVPRGVLLISPSVTAASISTLQDDGLAMRTAPSDPLQGNVMGLATATVEKFVKSATGASTVKVATVTSQTAYGSGIGTGIEAGLVFNQTDLATNTAAGRYQAVTLASSSASDVAAAVSKVTAFAPNIILVGTDVAGAALISGVEAALPPDAGAAPRPYYVLSDALQTGELMAYVAGAPDDVRMRIRGTTPWTPNSILAQEFKFRFHAVYQDAVLANGTPNAYDAMYVLAYLTVAAGAPPVTGRALVAAVPHITNNHATVIDTGPNHINESFQVLQSGSVVQLQGASGPLDFNPAGDVTTDFDVWCIGRISPQSVVVKSSGQTYATSQKAMTGTYTPCP